ncbi:MAG: cytochrome c [Burkholderiales bacterium]|nr:cytochrome c [Burkholderiales bacterium]
MSLRRGLGIAGLAALGALIALAGLVAWLNLRDEAPMVAAGAPAPASAELVARGLALTRAGDCVGCHTARGGAAYAGGRAIETPFGNVYSSNLTPDATTGLGGWSADEFWRALHHGRSKSGRLLYPAFPYPNYTRVARADADAMFAYLQSLPAVAQANKEHTLGFPFGTQAALAVWRALYFRPAVHVDDPARSAEWNRGAYLVEGLGHCNACHSARNALGATRGTLDLQGGLIPVQNWYAPSLASPREASVAGWPKGEVIQLLKTGISPRGFVMGPMSEVVANGTQYLSDADLSAMAAYLQALPAPDEPDPAPVAAQTPSARGASLYKDHCVDCHGERGEGVPGAYPALAGSRAVTMRSTANLVHVVLEGGFPPSTAGNPRPFGMPPFAPALQDAEVAELLSFVRASWGNRAAPVSALDVARARAGKG